MLEDEREKHYRKERFVSKEKVKSDKINERKSQE